MTVLGALKGADSLDEIARILGYKPQNLAYILYKLPSGEKYTKFTVPKKGDGEREIWAPEPRLKKMQRHLANLLYACYR